MPTYGAVAERQAEQYLHTLGHQTITRNFQYYGRGRGRRGEIDLITLHRDTLHFVEVKARRNTNFGHPLAAVTPTKIRTLHQTAEHFLTRYPKYRRKCIQMDVVAILGEKLEYYPRAF